VPKPPVLAGVIDEWNQVRKKARVLLVVDVSGSMGDEADPKSGDTKLDLAKRAAIAALGEFNADDEVGLRIFSTDISNREPTDYRDVVPIGPMSANRQALESNIERLHEFPDADRLGEVTEETGLKAFFDIPWNGIGRQCQHGNVGRQRVILENLQGAVAADARKVNVHQDDIGKMGAGQFDAEGPVNGR